MDAYMSSSNSDLKHWNSGKNTSIGDYHWHNDAVMKKQSRK
jgi:hypothetical protein